MNCTEYSTRVTALAPRLKYQHKRKGVMVKLVLPNRRGYVHTALRSVVCGFPPKPIESWTATELTALDTLLTTVEQDVTTFDKVIQRYEILVFQAGDGGANYAIPESQKVRC